MAQRGMAAYRQQAEAAGERRMSGFASILLLKSGDQVMGRFRGLFVEPEVKLTAEAIQALTPDWLEYHASVLGLSLTGKSPDEVVKMFLHRYTQVEPFIYDQHYIHGNKGRDAYLTCSARWSPATDCAACYCKDGGDKRVSLRTQYVVSFQPYRWYHKLDAKPGMKAQYVDCPAVRGENCRYCAAGHQAQQEQVRYLSFAEMHMAGLAACAERVSQRCGVCGIGKIKNTGYQCSLCQEPLSGYSPSAEGASQVVCPECRESMRPSEVLVCQRGCEMARRCQLHEVDVLVQRMGERKTTTYSFTEQWPAEPLPEELLALNLPNYDVAMKPVPTNVQCRQLGLVNNPFTNAVVPTVDGAETESYEAAGDPFNEDPAAVPSGDDPDSIPF